MEKEKEILNKMIEKEILDKIIYEILETKLVFEDIFYKIENENNYYIKLKCNGRIDSVYYDNFLQVVSYLQGIRKSVYSLERVQNEK